MPSALLDFNSNKKIQFKYKYTTFFCSNMIQIHCGLTFLKLDSNMIQIHGHCQGPGGHLLPSSIISTVG